MACITFPFSSAVIEFGRQLFLTYAVPSSLALAQWPAPLTLVVLGLLFPACLVVARGIIGHNSVLMSVEYLIFPFLAR